MKTKRPPMKPIPALLITDDNGKPLWVSLTGTRPIKQVANVVPVEIRERPKPRRAAGKAK